MRKKIYHYKNLLIGSLCLGAMAIIAIVVSNSLIEKTSGGKLFFAKGDVPVTKVGLVLGCSPTLSDGRENFYFRNRIQAASELFSSGRVEYLLVSGDNSRSDYDEPTAMKFALIKAGVPDDRIVLDYAGFSTFDSIIRANRVFGQTSMVVISQAFHVKRAIFIANSMGLNVSGYAAKDVSRRFGFKTRVREYLAKVKTVLDVSILGREPRFLGDPITIGQEA